MAKIETSLLTQQVYDVLREKIIAGEYKAGEKLDIHRLAEEFGVSRSPVKSAVNELVHDGLIEIIPRKGTYVTELDLTEFKEILDARLMIELWAAKQIIHNNFTEEVEKLGEITEKMDALLEVSPFSFESYNKLDIKFHSTLVEGAGNKKIHELFLSLNTHVYLSRIVHSTSLESTIKRHKGHARIYEAIKKHDLPNLSEAITEHINSIKKEAELRWDKVKE